MIDWLTILLALGITGVLVGVFGFVAWKMNMSDPLSSDLLAKKDESHGSTESGHLKKKKDKSGNDAKKRRKDAKKSRSSNRTDDEERHSVTFKEPTPVPSDDTDNDQDESEQGSITPPPPAPTVQIVGATLALSKRQKKRNRQTHSPSRATGPVEGILVNKDEKSPVTDHPEPIPHPKLSVMIPKDEVELAKFHHQTANATKSNQSSAKATPQAKKPAATNDTPRLQHQEQPFTVVNNRHKSSAPPAQPQQQQQQQPQPQRTKPTVAAAAAATPAPPPPAPAAPAPPAAAAQQEPLAQRQPVRPQKEAPPTQVNGFNNNAAVSKQSGPSNATAAPPMKISDMFKALTTSQAVVSELMLALDAYPLSADELNIVMHKIANKQSVINKDWTKLQHGQKVDPQAHMGQLIDESARASDEGFRTQATRQLKDLADELNLEKRRVHELLRERDDKEKTIQSLRNQFETFQQHQNSAQSTNQQQHQVQSLLLQNQRLTQDNLQLNQLLSQKQSLNTNDGTKMQLRLLQEQIEKVSVKNGDYEKKIKAAEALIEKSQKEKDEVLRSNQKLTQRAQQHQQTEDKLVKDLNESRALHSSQLNDFRNRFEQIERENEQLRQVELQILPPTTNNDEREKLEQTIQQLNKTIDENQQAQQRLHAELDEQKKKFDDFQDRFNGQENHYKQEIERLNQEKNDELNRQNESLAALRSELDEIKTRTNSNDERREQEQKKYRTYLTELLSDEARGNLPDDQKDDEQWLSSYRQIVETQKKQLSGEAVVLKQENDQLHQRMKEIESELREIEKTVQAKEETLLHSLRERDEAISNIHQENDRLLHEVHRLQSDHDSAASEILSLKELLQERGAHVNQPSPSTAPDESVDTLIPSSALPAKLDPRAEQLSELIRSSREAIENQDSIVQQLDKHIDDMQRAGRTGETNSLDVNGSNASSDQQQSES